MSTLVTDNFEHRATGDSVPAEYVVHGSAKAWATIDMTSPSILDSLNTSSLTDNGTGKKSPSWTNIMSAATYAVNVSIGQGGNKIANYFNIAIGSVEVGTQVNSTSTYTDYNPVTAIAHGELA